MFIKVWQPRNQGGEKEGDFIGRGQGKKAGFEGERGGRVARGGGEKRLCKVGGEGGDDGPERLDEGETQRGEESRSSLSERYFEWEVEFRWLRIRLGFN